MTIRTRLTLWFGGILVISLAIMAFVLHREWEEQQERLQRANSKPEPAWEEVGEIVLFYGLPTAMLLLGGSWILLRQSLAPVISMIEALESLNLNNLKQRLPRSGNGDELDRLTEVFNLMLQRLDHSLAQVREFTLNASHELKTPLTILRAELEVALRESPPDSPHREMFADQLDEIGRLTKIVDALTFLAKADAGIHKLSLEPVQLDTLLQDSVADAQLLAQSSNVRVELISCPETFLKADRHRLKQLLLNLTDNGIKYNCPDGSLRYELTHQGNDALLTIQNSGPGIEPEKLPYVFDRFYRGDASHSNLVEGSGLGLSIVQWIVKAHGGTLELASVPHQYTTVRVRFPRIVS